MGYMRRAVKAPKGKADTVMYCEYICVQEEKGGIRTEVALDI